MDLGGHRGALAVWTCAGTWPLLCSSGMRQGFGVLGPIVSPIDSKAATDNRDSLAKTIYSRLFDWLVEKINVSIGQDPNAVSLVGVLDIYGELVPAPLHVICKLTQCCPFRVCSEYLWRPYVCCSAVLQFKAPGLAQSNPVHCQQAPFFGGCCGIGLPLITYQQRRCGVPKLSQNSLGRKFSSADVVSQSYHKIY